jgi:hypothetical protein
MLAISQRLTPANLSQVRTAPNQLGTHLASYPIGEAMSLKT